MKAPAGGNGQRRGGQTPDTIHLVDYLAKYAAGRDRALPLPVVAHYFRVTVRQLQAAMADAILDGALIGSACSPPAGVFLILDERDLEEGTAHLRSRALSMLQRQSALRRAAAARFGEATALRLFDIGAVR